MSDVAAAFRRTAERYRTCTRFTRHYVASKLKRDPIHRTLIDLAAQAPFGHVVDVGCGRGQVAVVLLEAGLARSVTGLDWAGRLLADFQTASAGLTVETIARDLSTDFRVPAGDTVLIIDVLYTVERRAALALLEAAADAARDLILVRSMDAAAGWRGRFSLVLERLARPFWPHAGQTVDPLSLDILMELLHARGFDVQRRPCWGHTPFANVLLVGQRMSRVVRFREAEDSNCSTVHGSPSFPAMT